MLLVVAFICYDRFRCCREESDNGFGSKDPIWTVSGAHESGTTMFYGGYKGSGGFYGDGYNAGGLMNGGWSGAGGASSGKNGSATVA